MIIQIGDTAFLEVDRERWLKNEDRDHVIMRRGDKLSYFIPIKKGVEE